VNGIKETNFTFPGQTEVYNGKVRDVYFVDDKLVIVASDRISAFDHILPRPIPYKGQILTQIAPEGMKEGDKFPEPIITPATKAEEGHDEDISKQEILSQGIVTQVQWNKLAIYALQLFHLGTQMAEDKGLILVDTKYEFGFYEDDIILIDEIHTPDSSRYYYLDGYSDRQSKGEKQKQLSKEFVREWLMENGFQGKEGQEMPVMPDKFVAKVTDRYEELYTILTGQKLERKPIDNIHQRIEANVLKYLKGSDV